jgi:membrane protease YdiL (CAAX protease family)
VLAVTVGLQLGFHVLSSSSPQLKRFFAVTSLPAWVGIVADLAAYVLFVRAIERRPVVELAKRRAFPESAWGIGLGALLFATTIVILGLLGVFRIDGFTGWLILLPAIGAAASSAVFEEVLFRGIIFRLTEQSLGSWLALAISALLFGAVHLLNAHASLQGAAAIVLEAGIFLAAAFMATRRLWFVMGAHFGWNFTESGIFGTAISGYESRGLIHSTVQGPTYLSGGIFGVEASVVAIFVCLVAASALLWHAKKKNKFILPVWRRQADARR